MFDNYYLVSLIVELESGLIDFNQSKAGVRVYLHFVVLCSRPRSELFYLAQHTKQRMTNAQKKAKEMCMFFFTVCRTAHTLSIFIANTLFGTMCSRGLCMCMDG